MILEELLTYVRFSDEERAILGELHDALAPAFPAIAEAFYAAVLANADAARILADPAVVERLRRTLVEWMASGLRGPYDAAFEEKRSRIGKRHVEIGLAQHHMFGAMNVLRSAYGERIAALYPPARAAVAIRAVDKLFDVELGLVLQHYQHDQLAALQRMSAGLAHEIRNPLNAAKLQLELAERRIRRRDPVLAEPIEVASSELRRLADLLDEFLVFAQPTPLALAPHDVAGLASQVVDLEPPGSVELAAPPAVHAIVDAAKVQQIIANLVHNAIEAAGHAELSIEHHRGELVIRVRDRGPGIAPEIRRRVFEPFFSTKPMGTGMGLAVVDALVSQHGGAIALVSDHAGTCAEVRLPARAGAAS
ncbi:MAG TPA: protoglobin domain-containing protein [Kofleriaceae bacterium]|jgi:signal transduction histidine kinase